MDTQVRSLLSAAQKYGAEKGRGRLLQAYELMRNVAETRPAVDSPEPFAQDLFVICAEIAFQHEDTDMAKECLKMFFMKRPPTNQFLCRAYLCQAQLLAPAAADNPDQLEKAVLYLVKAINMAKDNQRYHFLVYNASVLYWQFCRPFLKPSFRQHLAHSLHQVVKALDDIDDSDYEWRAQLMIALIECHMDAGHRSDASHIAVAAVSFIKQHVPALYKTVYGLMIKHQLVDVTKLQKDSKASPELAIYYKICKIKQSIAAQDSEKDVAEEMRKVLAQIKGHMSVDDIKPQPTDVKKDRQGNASEESSVPTRKISTVARKTARSPSPGGSNKMLKADSLEKPYLLLELGRLAMKEDYPDVAGACVDQLEECLQIAENPSLFVELEFLQSELMVRRLGNKQESYKSNLVETRLQAIQRCDEAIQNARRLGSANVVQAGCVTQWNLCLPLLQANLRTQVRRPLTAAAAALEDINSLLVLLRCQVHTELAKCEEDQEQIELAMQHLHKALCLDDGGTYRERLEAALHRLELRAELYQQPDRAEDQAGMIIEQARKADSGTIRMKRSLLVRAGQALAPDAFMLVLESESDTKEVATGKGPLTQIKRLAGRAQQFNIAVKKAAGHLRRLGDENDRERAALWGDLAKTARKQEVWDVCRVAARFCLLYEDNRWKCELPPKNITPQAEKSRSDQSVAIASNEMLDKSQTDVALKSSVSRVSKVGEGGGSRPVTPVPVMPVLNRDLIRMLVEVHFINGEALIHLLRSEGVEVGDLPLPPQDKSKRPKGYVAKKPEEDPDWLEYLEWIKSLSSDAVTGFLRAAALGVDLAEPRIVCNAATYIWNYSNHILTQTRHREIVDTLSVLLEGLKKVGHAGNAELLVNLCTALAIGFIKPWEPAPLTKDAGGSSPEARAGSGKRRGAPTPAAIKSKPNVGTISPDAAPELKKAVEVCEYAMTVTNGDFPLDEVPIAVRQPLLQTWVRAKQMIQGQIGKGLGTEDETNDSGQNPMTRALVATEMLTLNPNGIMEFKDTPSLTQAADLVDKCQWTDQLVELQLYTRLAFLALQSQDHSTVSRCARKALVFADVPMKGGKQDPHRYVVVHELLSYASNVYGQSLVENIQGKNTVRRQAMQQFLASAEFGKEAGNTVLVMTAARHYWNTALPLINQPIERELVKEPLHVILDCINETTDKNKYNKEDEDEEDLPPETDKLALPPVTSDVPESDKPRTSESDVGGPEDDLTLRASIYGVLFQSYADKGEWQNGLSAMDQAINDMPRTNHRLYVVFTPLQSIKRDRRLIFKHLVMVKARLGQNVQMSIQKFKDESEDSLAHMWRRVALCSKQQLEQLQAYQYAIEALSIGETTGSRPGEASECGKCMIQSPDQSPSSEWQKFDYLLEFGQWLYCNEFPKQDALDQFEWAVDILFNMKHEVEEKKEPVKTSKKGKGKKEKKEADASEKTRGKKPDVDSAGHKSPEKSVVKEERDKSDKTPAAAATDPKSDTVDYIPVHKEIIIGVELVSPGLSVEDLVEVRQLEGLIRAHAVMAQVAGPVCSQHTAYLLQAYAYVIRIWQVSIGSSGPVLKDIAKKASEQPAEGSGKNSPKGKKGKEKDKEPVKEKPKRKGPLDVVPVTVEEWASYDIPEEVVEAFNHPAMKTSGINSNTITKPSVTLFYLEYLVKELRAVGYNHLVLPLLALAETIARFLLNSRPLTAYVHLRAMEVCLELNLMSAANFHEKLADFRVNEEEQAMSRQQMALWQEKQLQVSREEKRLRATLAKFSSSTKASSRSRGLLVSQNQGAQDKPSSTEGGTAAHLGQELGVVQLHKVWADTAELLIEQALYQPARELLNEAHLSAVAFKNTYLAARCLYLLGRLSFSEGQYGQASKFCQEAQQTFDGDEMFWFDTTILMVEATLKDYEMKNHLRQARGLLLHALTVFTDIAEVRPNKVSITGYILAQLEARLGSIQAELAFEEHDNVTKPKVVSALLSACKKLSHGSDQLFQLGYKRKSLEIRVKHSSILSRLARAVVTPAEKHQFYIQSVGVLREASLIADSLLQDVHTLTPLQQMQTLNTPIQREAAAIKLTYAEVLLEMLQVHIAEQHQYHLLEQRKASVVRAVEDLIRSSPDMTSADKEWDDFTRTLPELSLDQLVTAHNLSGPVSDLKAKSLYLTGRCLRLLASLKDANLPYQWTVQEMEVMKITQQLEKDEPKPGADPNEQTPECEEKPMDTDIRQQQKYAEIIRKLKASGDFASRYLAQATECLTQAVNLALTHQHKSVAGLAALELVECLGQFDSGLASHYLALHQSCEASTYMEGVLTRALVDPSVSQQAALFHQLQALRDNSVTSNLTQGPVYKTVMNTLFAASQAWQWLKISPGHLDLLKELPTNFVLVVMQLSPDRSRLYGSVLDRPKNVVGGKPQKGSVTQSVSQAKVVCADSSVNELNDLLDRCKWYRHDVMQTLLKFEYQRTQHAQRQKMLANIDDNLKQGSKELILCREVFQASLKRQTSTLSCEQCTSSDFEDQFAADSAEDEARLHEEFLQILSAMEDYLRPITSQLDACLRADPTPSPADQKPGRGAESHPSQDSLVILAHPSLLELPLEALQCFQHENIMALSREVSLQMLYNKVHVEPLDEAAEKAKKEKEKNKPPSRIPGLRDASKKQSKIIPLDRPVPVGCLPVDTHAFKYIVDPHLECSETEENAPIDVFEAMLEEHEQQFTPRWLGVTGKDHTPSSGEYEIYITESSGFVFYGMERFLSYLPPHKLAALSLPDCQLAMLFDLAQTNKSFSRHAKTDVTKTASRLSLEKPVDAALLLGLAGINSVMHNQWHCTLQENADKLQLVMKDILAKGITTGETVRLLNIPHRRPKEEEEEGGETNSQATGDQTGDEEQTETVKPEGEDEPGDLESPLSSNNRSWYNMVCYGAPNLLVTQLSKP